MTSIARLGVPASGLVAALLLGIGLPHAQESGRTSSESFTVPPGFEVERVAGPPLVDRPIVADFDDEGRLYVADSSGSNDRVEKQLADRPHRIVRLEDTNGDGRFDVSVVFADRMMLPEGTMWFDGSLYVAAPPSIWKLTDTDGDGVADRREEWYKGETLTGCANDLHGPYLGPDGWIYWTKGAFAQQTRERAGKPALVTRAAHILRRRPGDPAIEVVMTGGMDNPVDVAFTPSGERILTATFLEHPQAGRRDALVHAVYGGRVRKAAQRARRPHAHRRPHARHVPAGPGGSCRPHAIRISGLRSGLSRQLLRGDVQPAQGDAARAGARRCDVQDARFGLSRLGQSRLPSDRCHRGCRRESPRGRYRALVQAVLSDVPACQAGGSRRHLPSTAQGRADHCRPARASSWRGTRRRPPA